MVPGDGRVHFGLVLNLQDPPYCQNGAYLHQAGNGDPQTTWQRADAPPPGGGEPVPGVEGSGLTTEPDVGPEPVVPPEDDSPPDPNLPPSRT